MKLKHVPPARGVLWVREGFRCFFGQPLGYTAILALVIACEVLWRFSVTGLSTLFLMLIFLSLIWCLVWIESEERDPVWSHRAQTWLALAIGLLLGLGTLTRYSFGWLIIPVLVYLGIFCVLRRWRICLLVLGTFLGTPAAIFPTSSCRRHFHRRRFNSSVSRESSNR